MPVIDPHQSYTFRRYFDLRIDPIDLATYFRYQFQRRSLQLPQSTLPLPQLAGLQQSITDTIPRLVRLNEQAKREAFVFPVVNAVAAVTNALIRIEQPLKISEQLQGEVDYILSVKHLQNLVIIEAKRGDLDYGFTQLAAELIAIDQWDQAPAVADQPIIIGAVTMGDLWRFGMLDRQQQQIAEDIGSFRVPEDLDPILRILIQALTT
jgi:hypothetical protein